MDTTPHLPPPPHHRAPVFTRIALAVLGAIVLGIVGLVVWRTVAGLGWVRFEDESGRFAVDYPKDALVEETDTPNGVLVTFVVYPDTWGEMLLIVEPEPRGATAQDLAESVAGPTEGGATVLTVAEAISIGGTTGYRNVTDGPNWRREEVFVDDEGGVLVLVSMSGDLTEDASGITERFLESFELLDG